MVTVEESGIDLASNQSCAGNTHSKDDPVGLVGVVTSGLPSVVPGTGVSEPSSVSNWSLWLDEVLGSSKPFVRKCQHFPSKLFANNVCVSVDHFLLEFGLA
ncbi:hypothetical protein OGAPHI_000125 [Ogataea philodendri]|uniref:Uncharacterized protein n=1 Tax=Ogataea philodendri TaxID=1378263 RepID=A0A9P8PIL7_9ASCO|nr:uncharacterized protein OGAPHI_000125 [Ogataea philodendri]KAH3671939.1 hypothetical protein OGAPHI_000125 [Ogataea philodendri]